VPVSFPSGSIANFFVVARRIGAPATPRRWCQCAAGKTSRTLPETSMSGARPIGRANTTGSLCLDRQIISPPWMTRLPDRISGRGCCGSCATNSIAIVASRTQTGRSARSPGRAGSGWVSMQSGAIGPSAARRGHGQAKHDQHRDRHGERAHLEEHAQPGTPPATGRTAAARSR
jgi:hypothetical protein